MTGKSRVLLFAILLIGLGAPAEAEPWIRGFVLGSYEPGFYHGGGAGFARPGSGSRAGDHAVQPSKPQRQVSHQVSNVH